MRGSIFGMGEIAVIRRHQRQILRMKQIDQPGFAAASRGVP